MRHRLTSRLARAARRGAVVVESLALLSCGDATGPNRSRVAAVTVSPATLTIYETQTAKLSASARDRSGAQVAGAAAATWSVSDTAVAGVGTAGLVVAKRAGTTAIRATIDGVAGVAELTVRRVPVADVVVAPDAPKLFIGQTATLSATARDSAGGTLAGRAATWSSADTAVATIGADDGVVTARRTGTVTLSATVEGKTGSTTLAVSPVPVAAVTVVVNSPTLVIGQSTQALVVAKDSAGGMLTGRAVDYASSAPGVATVSTTGLVAGVAKGTATITATVEGHSASAGVTVVPPVATIEVTPTEATMSPGQALQLGVVLKDADGNVLTDGRPVSYATSDAAVATVSAYGIASIAAPGTVTITATCEGKSASATITAPNVPASEIAQSLTGRLAFTATSVDAQRVLIVEVHVMNADGSGEYSVSHDPVTQGRGWDQSPSWSPDGTQLAFIGFRDTTFAAFVVNADGTGERAVVYDVGSVNDHWAAWSVDGSRLFVPGTAREDAGIYTVGLDGSGLTYFGPGAGVAVSPDGQRIALALTDANGVSHINVMAADGSGAHRVDTELGTTPAVEPVWSPDGTRIAFQALYRDGGRSDIAVVNADGTGFARVTRDTTQDISPAWSPDGRVLIFSRSTGDAFGSYHLHAVRVDGAGLLQITKGGERRDLDPSWTR